MWIFFRQIENKRYLNEHKFLYLKPKQVSCDDIYLNESDYRLPNNIQIGNLSSCLWQKLNENDFESFSNQLNDESIQLIFDKFFILDNNTGLIFQRENIDREKICLRKTSDNNLVKTNEFLFTAKNSSLANDHFECDCDTSICRISLTFVAFKKTTNSAESRIKKNKFKQFNKNSMSNNHVHKYLSLNINIRDMNDNRPFFKKNFLYLNISEQYGQNLALDNFVPSDNLLCNVLISNFDLEIVNNHQIKLEKPYDSDSNSNSELIYKLIILSNQEMDYIQKLEAEFEQNQVSFKSKVNNIIENFKENCFNRFELIENNLNQELYLKINTFLDREQQSVYNFILLVLEKNYISSPELDEKNFLLFSLKLNDLNDNRPKFNKAKYSFYLNEATYYKKYYKENNLADSKLIYLNYLEQICDNFKNLVKVIAHDLDEGANSEIKYKIIQQINRKNSNTKTNHQNDILIDSVFSIDQNGSIQLETCRKLDLLESLSFELFIDLTQVLDYELFHKHVIVVEATDSNNENPLSSVVTVDINLMDLNDNKPIVLSLYSSNCVYQKGLDLNISVQEANSEEYSTKIMIDGLSELSAKGSCIGQFLVKDLDTEATNIEINSRILQDTSQNLFLFKNLKNQNSTFPKNVPSTEIFELYLNFEPDAEFQSVYNLVIELTDSGQLLPLKSQTELTVLIKDENDNDPKFDQDKYVFYIDEWNEYDSNKFNSLAYCFTRLEAHDSDITYQNKLIVYSLEAIQPRIKLKNSNKIRRNKEENNFYIDESTGYLCVKDRSLLDRETRSRYDFFVRATNQNSTVYAQTSVQVIINDLNDNPPQFKKKDYKFYITEKYSNLVTSLVISDSNEFLNLDKTLIGNVKAFDQDSLNSEILYFVDNADPENMIQLNTKNPSNPLLRSNNLIIFDNELSIEEKIFSHNTDIYDSLVDNLMLNESIFYHVTAIKHDDPEKKLINKKVFKPVDNLNEILYVDSYTGDIYLLNSFIDKEKILNIKFKIYAKDRQHLGDTSLQSWTNVTIEIDDINDCKPICYTKQNFLNEKNNTLEILAIILNYLNLELNKNCKMALVYEFKCVDLDYSKKNSDLKYEIEEFDLKSMNGKMENDRSLVKNFNNFMKFFRIFKLDSSAGKLYVDLSSNWWRSDLNKFLSFVKNYFLIIKFKISDDGIIPLSNFYQLEMMFCMSDSDQNEQICSLNGIENSKPVLTKRLMDYQYENFDSKIKDTTQTYSSTLPPAVKELQENKNQDELDKKAFLNNLESKTIIPRTTIIFTGPSANRVDFITSSNRRVYFSIVNLLLFNLTWLLLF